MIRAPGRPGVWAVAVLAASSACAGVRIADQPLSGNYAWPAGVPRVRLERVIPLEGDRRGPLKLFAWLAGRREAATFRRPYGVAWEGGNLLIADPDTGRIARIEPAGGVTLSPPAAVTSPIGVAACAGGVVATDAVAGKVALLGPDLGRVRWLAEGLERPTGVACDRGTVFIAETGKHRVVVIEPDGLRRTLGERGQGPGQFNFPTAVAVAGASLWVGDTLNFRIQRLRAASGAADGAFGQLGDSAGEMPRIKGIAVDSFGHLWVSDGQLDRVSLYTAGGALLMSLGRTGGEPGEFSFPAGVAAHADGRVAVSDSLNRRVQVFRLVAREGPP